MKSCDTAGRESCATPSGELRPLNLWNPPGNPSDHLAQEELKPFWMQLMANGFSSFAIWISFGLRFSIFGFFPSIRHFSSIGCHSLDQSSITDY
jgi:hypothetical protein